MQARSLILAACVALAAGACQTTPGDDAGDAPDPNRNASASAAGATMPAEPTQSLPDPDHDALMVQMGPKVNAVGVTMHGTAAHLTGHVHSEADKQRAHDVAHAVSGVTAVDISALAVQP
jgi:hypothetical protein